MLKHREKHKKSTNVKSLTKIVWLQQFSELDRISHGADVVGQSVPGGRRTRNVRTPARRTSCAAVVESSPSMRWKMSVARNVIYWRRLTGLFPCRIRRAATVVDGVDEAAQLELTAYTALHSLNYEIFNFSLFQQLHTQSTINSRHSTFNTTRRWSSCTPTATCSSRSVVRLPSWPRVTSALVTRCWPGPVMRHMNCPISRSAARWIVTPGNVSMYVRVCYIHLRWIQSPFGWIRWTVYSNCNANELCLGSVYIFQRQTLICTRITIRRIHPNDCLGFQHIIWT